MLFGKSSLVLLSALLVLSCIQALPTEHKWETSQESPVTSGGTISVTSSDPSIGGVSTVSESVTQGPTTLPPNVVSESAVTTPLSVPETQNPFVSVHLSFNENGNPAVNPETYVPSHFHGYPLGHRSISPYRPGPISEPIRPQTSVGCGCPPFEHGPISQLPNVGHGYHFGPRPMHMQPHIEYGNSFGPGPMTMHPHIGYGNPFGPGPMTTHPHIGYGNSFGPGPMTTHPHIGYGNSFGPGPMTMQPNIGCGNQLPHAPVPPHSDFDTDSLSLIAAIKNAIHTFKIQEIVTSNTVTTSVRPPSTIEPTVASTTEPAELATGKTSVADKVQEPVQSSTERKIINEAVPDSVQTVQSATSKAQ